MGGELLFAVGLVSSALAAAVAGLPWVAIAVGVAAAPYLVAGVVHAVDVRRTGRTHGLRVVR